MDAADGSAEESVMIALLPSTADWCQLKLPHLTLVYAGLKKDLRASDFSELAKDVAMLASLSPTIGLRVMSKERFGPNQDTDVFVLQPTQELWAMRRAVEKWNASEFPFNPHVTIGPAGATGTYMYDVPSYIHFRQIMLGWGDEHLVFRLGSG